MSLPVYPRLGSLLTLVIVLLGAACAGSQQAVFPYSASPEPTLPADLLRNPDFSAGVLEWNEVGAEGPAVRLGYDLAGFLTMAVTPAAEPRRAGWEQAVAVEPGRSYRASCRMRTEDLAGYAGLCVGFSDAAGRLLWQSMGVAGEGDAGWSTYGWRCRAPVGAAWATITVGVDGARAGHAAFDDVRFGPDDSPPVRPLIVDYAQVTGEVRPFRQQDYDCPPGPAERQSAVSYSHSGLEAIVGQEQPLQAEPAYQAAHLAATAIYWQDAALSMACAGCAEGLPPQYHDGIPTAVGQAYRELAGLEDTPQRLAVVGSDDLGFAVLAGKSEDGLLVRVVIADTGSSSREYRLALADFPPGYSYEVREISERCAAEVFMAGSHAELPGGMLVVPWRSPAVHVIDFSWEGPTQGDSTHAME